MHARTVFRFVALACLVLTPASLVSRAHAQDEIEEDTASPLVRFELAGRFGIGAQWYEAEADAVPAVGTSSAFTHLGAMVALRDPVTGLGGSVGYAHTFQGGLDEHYGIHALEVRLSELVPLYEDGGLRVGLLAELGGVYATGGGYEEGCNTFSGFCSVPDRTVDVELAGGVAALGLQLSLRRFLIALEVDYRVLGSVRGPLELEQDLVPLVRIGVTLDG